MDAAVSEELKGLKERAKIAAISDIEQHFSKPEDLDHLEHDIKKNVKKKEEYDSQLKTAVESQLEGIKKGVNLLKDAEKEVKIVDQLLEQFSSQLDQTPVLKAKIESVKDEYQRHKRLTTATNNMAYVFSAPSKIEEIKSLLETGEQQHLLLVHKLLHELERSRDGLMQELHGQACDADRDLLRAFFKDVPGLANALWNRIACTFSRVLDTAMQNPRLLVTAVRIVDREEATDRLWEERALRGRGGFCPEGRPRRWRDRMFQAMLDAVVAKLEASMPLTSQDSEQWLEQHCLLLQDFLRHDLLVARKLCPACFPSDYAVFDFYLRACHQSLEQRLSGLAKQALASQLQFKDCVSLVKWTETFKAFFDRLGQDILFDPQFNMEAERQRLGLQPYFLPQTEMEALVRHSVGLIGGQVWKWFQNTIEKEKRTWYEDPTGFRPERDLTTNTTYTSLVTSVSAILSDMMSQVSSKLPRDAHILLSVVIVEKLLELLKSYASSVRDFVQFVKGELNPELRQKKVITMEAILVASVNNLNRLILVMSQVLKTDSDQGANDQTLRLRKQSLEETCLQTSREWMGFLATEVIEYLQEAAFKDLFSPAWIQRMTSGETEGQRILSTVQDSYDNVYKDMFKTAQPLLLRLISERLCQELLRALLAPGKQPFREHRIEVANRLKSDAELLKEGFAHWNSRADHFDALVSASEILRLSDMSMAELEVSAFVRNFPDIRQDQLEVLFMLRGDCKRDEARSILVHTFSDEERARRNPSARQLFSLLPMPK